MASRGEAGGSRAAFAWCAALVAALSASPACASARTPQSTASTPAPPSVEAAQAPATAAISTRPIQPAASLARAVVIVPAGNMHSQPTFDSDVVSQAPYATTVDILEMSGGWARVRSGDEYEGWVPLEEVRWLRAGEADYGAGAPVVRVRSLFANLYREPNVTRHKPIVTVPLGAVLELAAPPAGQAMSGTEATPVSQRPDARWLMVVLPDRRPAWVQRGDVSSDWPPLAVPDVVSFAKRFLGVPYLWGGTTSLGLDCSGYMQLLMRRRGVTMPRDAGPQSRWDGTAEVPRAELAPGDLLYFGEVETKITHTGMYIGEGEFIHATANTTPVVQVSRLDAEPWTTLLKRCRRLVP